MSGSASNSGLLLGSSDLWIHFPFQPWLLTSDFYASEFLQGIQFLLARASVRVRYAEIKNNWKADLQATDWQGHLVCVCCQHVWAWLHAFTHTLIDGHIKLFWLISLEQKRNKGQPLFVLMQYAEYSPLSRYFSTISKDCQVDSWSLQGGVDHQVSTDQFKPQEPY